MSASDPPASAPSERPSAKSSAPDEREPSEERPSENAESTARPRADQASEAPNKPWLDVVWPYALRYGPALVVTAFLARWSLGAILDKAGEPAVPLDDAYIHFQYAKALAQGRFYAFVAGEGYTSGATSLIWPALMAPFYLLGFRGTSIIYVAWFLGFFFLALLAVETKRLAEPLIGEQSGIVAGATTLLFGGYLWFAASGMEVSPLAYVLARTARHVSEWQEKPEARSLPLLKRLLALAILSPLVRPEGALCSGMVVVTLAAFEGRKIPQLKKLPTTRILAAVALLGPLIHPALNWIFTGSAASSTTLVKWLPMNPYYSGWGAVWQTVQGNLGTFYNTLLNGKEWSAIFIPAGSRPMAVAAFAGAVYTVLRTKRWYRGMWVVLLCVGMALPATYMSFLWNRLRYLWPFAFAWAIGLAAIGRALADFGGLFRARFALAAPWMSAVPAGLLAHHLHWTVHDVSQSAYAIHNQQVKLGRWAKKNLPPNARIGVNDTGAIAYFSELKTFDVVGLTTPNEARYWVEGAGSRYEHYERMAKKSPAKLPTHFIVYSHWMACDPVLGSRLHSATVTDQSILGGHTMTAYKADYRLLNSGAAPLNAPAGYALVDELDVADLESEGPHGYDVRLGGASERYNRVRSHIPEQGPERAEGVREKRAQERFTLRSQGKSDLKLLARWGGDRGVQVELKVNGKVLQRHSLAGGKWQEVSFNLPKGLPASFAVELRANGEQTFDSMHYWLYGRP